jgi:hypothetical protein
MARSRQNAVGRFARHFVASLALVIVTAFLALAVEYSPVSQAVAPHSPTSERTQLVVHHGQPYVKVTQNSSGRQTVYYRHVLPASGPTPTGHGAVRIKEGAAPAAVSHWRRVVEILALITLVALVIATLDRALRTLRRRRRRSRSALIAR